MPGPPLFRRPDSALTVPYLITVPITYSIIKLTIQLNELVRGQTGSQ